MCRGGLKEFGNIFILSPCSRYTRQLQDTERGRRQSEGTVISLCGGFRLYLWTPFTFLCNEITLPSSPQYHSSLRIYPVQPDDPLAKRNRHKLYVSATVSETGVVIYTIYNVFKSLNELEHDNLQT